MALSTRDELKDKISEKLAHHLLRFTVKATNLTAKIASIYGANKAVNYATGRNNTWRSYLNPLEYMRSAMQVPATVFAVQQVEDHSGVLLEKLEGKLKSIFAVQQVDEHSGTLLDKLGDQLKKAEPIAEKFMQPIIRATISPFIDALEAEGLVKVPQISILEKATDSVFGEPFRAAQDLSSQYLFSGSDNLQEKATVVKDSWKIAEQQAPKYGEMVVHGLNSALDRSKSLRALPERLMNVMTETTGAHPLVIYGGVAAASLLMYFGTQSLYNSIFNSETPDPKDKKDQKDQTQLPHVANTGNVVHNYILPAGAVIAPGQPQPLPTPVSPKATP